MPVERRFGKKLPVGLLSISLTLVFILSLTNDVSGKPFRLSKIPDGGKKFKCATCHANPKGGQPLSAFGNDWNTIALEAGDKYTEDLGKMDSDGDGFTNDQEFDARTNPGDLHSRPTR
ncbi:hypothetical protein ACFLZT_04160 [Thermodesulfobacteriota bacterium]